MTPRANRNRTREAERRAAMYRAEIADRAALLRRLGYPAPRARARLQANLSWDFEVGGGGRPAEVAEAAVDKLLKAAYQR